MVATTPSRPCPVGRRSWGRGEAVATSVRVSRSQSVGVRDTETGGSTLSGAWGPCPGGRRTGGPARGAGGRGASTASHRRWASQAGAGRGGPRGPWASSPHSQASAGRRLGSEDRLRTACCTVGLCAWATIVRAASASLSMAQCVVPSPSRRTKCCAWARAGARSTCSSRAGLGGWPGCTAGPGRHGRQAHAGLDRKREPGPHGAAGPTVELGCGLGATGALVRRRLCAAGKAAERLAAGWRWPSR